jgi:hypothetical protein
MQTKALWECGGYLLGRKMGQQKNTLWTSQCSAAMTQAFMDCYFKDEDHSHIMKQAHIVDSSGMARR